MRISYTLVLMTRLIANLRLAGADSEPMPLETLVDVIEQLKQDGYGRSLTILKGGLLQSDTGDEIDPEKATIVSTYRFEGESDPADMSVAYAVEAISRAGARVKGVLVETFGAYADREYAQAAERMRKPYLVQTERRQVTEQRG